MKLTPSTLVTLISMVKEGRLNRNTAVKVFEDVFDTDEDVEEYVKVHGLAQINDPTALAAAVEKVFAANSQSVTDYRSGKEKAYGVLVGQVMREMKGRADPQAVNEAVRDKLSG